MNKEIFLYKRTFTQNWGSQVVNQYLLHSKQILLEGHTEN